MIARCPFRAIYSTEQGISSYVLFKRSVANSVKAKSDSPSTILSIKDKSKYYSMWITKLKWLLHWNNCWTHTYIQKTHIRTIRIISLKFLLTKPRLYLLIIRINSSNNNTFERLTILFKSNYVFYTFNILRHSSSVSVLLNASVRRRCRQYYEQCREDECMTRDISCLSFARKFIVSDWLFVQHANHRCRGQSSNQRVMFLTAKTYLEQRQKSVGISQGRLQCSTTR